MWGCDDVAYSPSALSMRILNMAGMEKSPKSIEGPAYWFLPEHGSLTAYAERLLEEEEPE